MSLFFTLNMKINTSQLAILRSVCASCLLDFLLGFLLFLDERSNLCSYYRKRVKLLPLKR